MRIPPAPVASENLPRALSESMEWRLRGAKQRKNGLSRLFSPLSDAPAVPPRHFALPPTVFPHIYRFHFFLFFFVSFFFLVDFVFVVVAGVLFFFSSSSLLLLARPVSSSGHLSHAPLHTHQHASQEIVPILSFAFSSPRHDLQIAYK